MKTSTLIIVLVVGFLTTSVSAQETIWMDANWHKTDKEKATYYRPAPKKQKNGFWIVDYFLNGTKQMEGFSFSAVLDNEKFDGLVKYYHSNGKIYQEIHFNDGLIQGERKIYYTSGQLKEQKFYENGKIEGKFKAFHESGETLELGSYSNGKKDGTWKIFYKNGKIKERGKYDKGEKIGIWKTFYKNVYKQP